MNDMAKRMDAFQPETTSGQAQTSLSEIDAFMCYDEVLASLNKQYLEAKQQRKELIAMNGAEDAMAEVAMDMEDSAWCAMQTRYIELRQERELMEKVQRLMRQSEEAAELEIQKDKEKQLDKYIYWSQTVQKIREMNTAPRIFEWAILLSVFKMTPFDQMKDFHSYVPKTA